MEAANLRLENTIDDLKNSKSISEETIARLRTEIATFKQKVFVLEQASKELGDNRKLSDEMEARLKKVIAERDTLAEDITKLNESHRLRVKAITDAKIKMEQDLRSKIASGLAAQHTMKEQLDAVKEEVAYSLKRENAVLKAHRECEAVVRSLKSANQRCRKRVNKLIGAIQKNEVLRQKQTRALKMEIHDVKNERPITLSAINNRVERVRNVSNVLSVRVMNINVKSPGLACIGFTFRTKGNKLTTRSIHFRGVNGLDVPIQTGASSETLNIQQGGAFERAIRVADFKLTVRRISILKNGWTFTFTPSGDNKGQFVDVSVGVEQRNPGTGMTEIQISGVAKKPLINITPRIPSRNTPTPPDPAVPVQEAARGRTTTIVQKNGEKVTVRRGGRFRAKK